MPSRLMKAFLENAMGPDVSVVLLLGDIFDLMLGGHKEFITKHRKVFDGMAKVILADKKIYYFEGNHDYHLSELFSVFLKDYNLPESGFSYIKKGIILNVEDVVYFATHGDEVEIENTGYRIFKAIMNNRFMSLFTTEVLSFELIDKLGEWVSNKSREKNSNRYSAPEMQGRIKEKFRRSAESFVQSLDEKIDYLVCGHSHVKDNFLCTSGTRYLNNGYAPITKTYLVIDNSGARFHDL